MKTKPAKYAEWTRIEWDGNPELNLECYRKSFRRGHVSVGIGPEFLTIAYSYGPHHDDSMCSSRFRLGGQHLTEQEAMQLVDADQGYPVKPHH